MCRNGKISMLIKMTLDWIWWWAEIEKQSDYWMFHLRTVDSSLVKRWNLWNQFGPGHEQIMNQFSYCIHHAWLIWGLIVNWYFRFFCKFILSLTCVGGIYVHINWCKLQFWEKRCHLIIKKPFGGQIALKFGSVSLSSGFKESVIIWTKIWLLGVKREINVIAKLV